jgi:hypothetical protein
MDEDIAPCINQMFGYRFSDALFRTGDERFFVS